jgi:hypothetical protein
MATGAQLQLQQKSANRLSSRPASATAATTTAAPIETTASATVTTPTCRLRASFVHVHRPAVKFRAVQLRDGRFRVPALRHFHKSEAARLTRVPIRNNIDPFHSPVLREGSVQLILVGLIAEIPDKNIDHQTSSLFVVEMLVVVEFPARRGDAGKREDRIGRRALILPPLLSTPVRKKSPAFGCGGSQSTVVS